MYNHRIILICNKNLMPNQNKTRLAREGVINLIKFSILISRIPSPQYKEVRSVLVRRPSQFIVQLMTIPNISHMIYIVAEFYSPPWYLQYLMGRNLSICTDLRMYLRCPCMTPLHQQAQPPSPPNTQSSTAQWHLRHLAIFNEHLRFSVCFGKQK